MLRNELKDNIVLMNLNVNDCNESVLLFNLVPSATNACHGHVK